MKLEAGGEISLELVTHINELDHKLKTAVEALKFGLDITSSDFVTITNLDMMEMVFKDALKKIDEV